MYKNYMKNLYCIIGKSGSGKTTIVNELKKYGLESVDSYTTRPPRHENEQGHIFVDKSEFDKIRHDLCAYTLFSGYEYGATNAQVNECDLYVIDYDGYLDLKRNYKGNKDVVSIYIYVPSNIREQRMRDRNDSDLIISKRLFNDRFAFARVQEKCDYRVENYDLDIAVKQILNIINPE